MPNDVLVAVAMELSKRDDEEEIKTMKIYSCN